jgi:hypothetical protein
MIPQIAISVFFFNAAVTLEASSGKLVPIATIVTQIKDLGISNPSAIPTAQSTINFHPTTSPTSPHKVNATDFHVGISTTTSSAGSFLTAPKSGFFFGLVACLKM